MYVRMYVCMYVYVCIYIYVYIGAGGSTVHDVTGQSVTWAGTRSQKSVLTFRHSVCLQNVFS